MQGCRRTDAISHQLTSRHSRVETLEVERTLTNLLLLIDGVGKNYVRMQAAPHLCAVAGEQPQTYHCGSWPCLCLPGRYGSSLFLLVVIPSGFGFGGSIPVIPARLAQGFACHPINLRLSQEAYAVRGTCHRHPHEFQKPIIAVVSVFVIFAIFASTHHDDSGWSHRWLENDCCSGGSK